MDALIMEGLPKSRESGLEGRLDRTRRRTRLMLDMFSSGFTALTTS